MTWYDWALLAAMLISIGIATYVVGTWIFQ